MPKVTLTAVFCILMLSVVYVFLVIMSVKFVLYLYCYIYLLMNFYFVMNYLKKANAKIIYIVLNVNRLIFQNRAASEKHFFFFLSLKIILKSMNICKLKYSTYEMQTHCIWRPILFSVSMRECWNCAMLRNSQNYSKIATDWLGVAMVNMTSALHMEIFFLYHISVRVSDKFVNQEKKKYSFFAFIIPSLLEITIHNLRNSLVRRCNELYNTSVTDREVFAL